MKFSQLLEPGLTSQGPLDRIAQGQREAGRRFPAVAREHGFRLVDPSQSGLASPAGTIIGVAAEWAVLDMQILDDLSGTTRDWVREPVELLDISSVEGSAFIERLSPGCTRLGHTPIVIQIEAGRVVRTETGKAARDFLRAVYLGKS